MDVSYCREKLLMLIPKAVAYGLEKVLTCKCHTIESKSLIKVLTVEAGSRLYPTDGWSTSLEEMPIFTRAEMNEHIARSGKNISDIPNHSVPTSLKKSEDIPRR